MFVKRIIVIMLVISVLFIVNNLSAQDVGPDGFFRYSYPIEMPPGINGMQPSISLEYNSFGENGFIGKGWSVGGLPYIARDSRYPITIKNTKDHYCYI